MKKENRIVMTLDAGGTNFVFSAYQDLKGIVEPISVPVKGMALQPLLKAVITQFRHIETLLPEPPVAISFGFPGPCDYPAGIVGDLENLPCFRGGVALGPMLEDEFKIPVFINNDADLFAYGESIKGLLPAINREFEKAGSPKRYYNLFGVTLGTGFGGGIVSHNQLAWGDNAVSGEINRITNKLYPDYSVEESVSIKGVRRVYAREAGIAFDELPEPKDIYEIAIGEREGNKTAALRAFDELAIVLAQSLTDSITLIDGIVAIGGGLANASKLFLPKVLEELRKPYKTPSGNQFSRLELEVFNLDDEKERAEFIKGDVREITVPFNDRKILYDAQKRVGIGRAVMRTHEASSVGAYVFALNKLDGKR
ncbi:MAG: ROK family protein [Bacteroidales bacterium]|jgi:glucokinase|nr:ROK family protein [Bacteroidales bacterium]